MLRTHSSRLPNAPIMTHLFTSGILRFTRLLVLSPFYRIPFVVLAEPSVRERRERALRQLEVFGS